MTGQEGVIKFQLLHTPGPPLALKQVVQLMAWRGILHQLELVGADPNRYDGLGFGNLSRRIALPSAFGTARPFIISGTQTGFLRELAPEHFTTVSECVPEANRVVSFGPIEPSSEAMTHAAIYGFDPNLRNVIHVHSPRIWRAAVRLKLPRTPESAACGTLAMAEAVREVLREGPTRKLRCFVMGGHEDGVIAFGRTMDQAGTALLRLLAKAHQLR